MTDLCMRIFTKLHNSIIQRNRERHEQEEKKRLEEEFRAECPPGMTILSEDERLETVAILKQSSAPTLINNAQC